MNKRDITTEHRRA